MLLKFIIIGLICNANGCYWAIDDSKIKFEDQTECQMAATARQQYSIMYFKTACMVYNKNE